MKRTAVALALIIVTITAAPALRAEYALDYSTYLGGTGWDEVRRLAVEGTDIYLAGKTQSRDFPTLDAFQPAYSSDGLDWDAWVARFSGDGSLVYSSYLGGGGEDGAWDIEASGGSAYVSGLTASTNFPTVLPYQAANAGERDLFYCVVDGSGGLVFSSYLGGTGSEYNGRIALAPGGAFYLAGHTFSSDYPTFNPYQAAKAGGTYDLVLTRFSSLTAAQPDFSTYLGGSGSDSYPALAAFGDGAILAGMTSSADFPTTPEAFQQAYAGSNDAVVARFDSSGNLLMSTFAGGTATEMGMDVGASSSEFAVSGGTASYNFPTVNPYQAERKGLTVTSYDNFLTIFSAETCVFSSYLGGTSDDYAGALWFTESDILLSGHTSSTNFPTADPFQEEHAPGTYDAFVARFDSSRNLIFSSYLGGSGTEENTCGVGMIGERICLAGATVSDDFPTADPFQAARGGNRDVFLSILRRLTPTPVGYKTPIPTPTPTPSPVPTQWLDCSAPVMLSCPIFHSGTTAGAANNAIDYDCQADLTGPEVAHRLDFPGEGDITIRLNTANLAAHLLLLGSCDIDDCLAHWGPNTDGTYIGATAKSYFLVVDSFAEFSDAYELTGACFLYGTPTPTVPPTPPPTIPPTPPPSVPPTPPPSVPPSPSPTCSVSCEFRVSGAVLDQATSSPLVGAEVTMTYADTLSDTTVSGAGGDYSFEIYNHHTPGPVTLEAEHPGYRTGYSYTAWECYSEITGLDILLDPITPTPTPIAAPRWIRDYNGDGTSDVAVFRPSSGLWAVRGVTRLYFGSDADTLVPGDYRGDGTTLPAVFRPASGLWAVRGFTRLYFGSSADRPLPGDYDGNGTCDPAIFRESSGLWAVKGVTRLYFGTSTDLTVPGYYQGSTAAPAIFRPSSGLWAVRGVTRLYFGSSTDVRVPGDYSGTGSWSPAVFRPSSGLWAVRGVTRLYFGTSTDLTVPGVYRGDGTDLPGIFRPASGLWAVKGLTRAYFGGSSDLPVSR